MSKNKKSGDPTPEKEEQTAPAEEQAAENAAAESEAAEKQPDAGAELEAALAAERDKYLRLAAEYDNFRKRSQKEREALYADVRADTVSKLLPVYDNLARALAQGSTDEAFFKGVEMTMSQLTSIFEGLGVTAIEAEGQAFDPAVHNAVMHIEDENYGEGVVVQELQKGFKLGDKVIRHSMVQVAN